MPRWAELLLTLVLFAVVMAAASWVVGATVPGAVDWLADRIGIAAVLALLAAVIAASGAYAWHGYRKEGARAKGR